MRSGLVWRGKGLGEMRPLAESGNARARAEGTGDGRTVKGGEGKGWGRAEVRPWRSGSRGGGGMCGEGEWPGTAAAASGQRSGGHAVAGTSRRAGLVAGRERRRAGGLVRAACGGSAPGEASGQRVRSEGGGAVAWRGVGLVASARRPALVDVGDRVADGARRVVRVRREKGGWVEAVELGRVGEARGAGPGRGFGFGRARRGLKVFLFLPLLHKSK